LPTAMEDYFNKNEKQNVSPKGRGEFCASYALNIVALATI